MMKHGITSKELAGNNNNNNNTLYLHGHKITKSKLPMAKDETVYGLKVEVVVNEVGHAFSGTAFIIIIVIIIIIIIIIITIIIIIIIRVCSIS